MSEAAVQSGLRALRHLSTHLSANSWAQHVHAYERVPNKEYMVRHVATVAECPTCSWLGLIEDALFAALSQARGESYPEAAGPRTFDQPTEGRAAPVGNDGEDGGHGIK